MVEQAQLGVVKLQHEESTTLPHLCSIEQRIFAPQVTPLQK